jgi:F-type H+-transporting ATPase subunit epsilon
VDVSRASAALERAEQRLSRLESDVDYERARTALDKAALRLEIATKARQR